MNAKFLRILTLGCVEVLLFTTLLWQAMKSNLMLLCRSV
jgi:hypothetical protein